MPRDREAVRTIARRLSGMLLMWSVLASSGSDVALARQDQPQFPSHTDARAHLTARHSSGVMQVHIDDDSAVPQFDDVGVPPNLIVSAPLQQIVRAMLRDSPTFRRQCARLAGAPSLTVTLEPVLIAANARSQAITNFGADRDGRKHAHVQLGQLARDRQEIIAHEFEHIIEQLDGVDLPSVARQTTAGVHLTDDADRFETDRAVAIGRQVSDEIRTAERKRM
jgi:hypothetical protein